MYKIELSQQAGKDLEKIYRSDRSLYQRLLGAFEYISNNPDHGKPLHGKLRGLLSYRMGSYRILYQIHHGRLLVIIVDIGHRKDIYK